MISLLSWLHKYKMIFWRRYVFIYILNRLLDLHEPNKLLIHFERYLNTVPLYKAFKCLYQRVSVFSMRNYNSCLTCTVQVRFENI